MKHEIIVPSLGESINQGILVQWLKKQAEFVREGEELFELETDKATLSVPATASGFLNILTVEGSEVSVGQTVGLLESETNDTGVQQDKPISSATEASEGQASDQSREEHYSPSVRRLIAEHDLDPGKISGSGKEGRLTKADVLSYLEKRKEMTADHATSALNAGPKSTLTDIPEPAGKKLPGSDVREKATVSGTHSSGRQQRRVPVSTIRRRIAERLVQAQNQAAFLTTFNEVDMSRIIDLRQQYQAIFEEKHGTRLGIMSFFVRAVCHALAGMPEVNAYYDTHEIMYNDFYDIGIAVSTDRGLVVPVIKDANLLSLADIEKQIADYAQRARTKKLTFDELTGGTFSISNGGVFGSLLSTPIPNPPQTAILGLHAIQKRAVVRDDNIIVKPMMYIALSYDHRLIDGREAVTFLRTIKELVENPERLLLEV